MRIMITGSGGFVGNALVNYLTSECNHFCGLFDLVGGLDITNKKQVDYFFDRFRPHIVYHLAAQINPKRSEKDREFDWKINVEGTLNIIDAMIENGVNVLVFTSSDAVVDPVSNYGVSKRAAEEYILKYTRQNKIQGKIARFSSVYGIGRDSRGPVNIFCEQAVAGKDITVYDSAKITYRDYINVQDCVRALEIIQRDGEIGGVYNVGTGVKHSVTDVAYLVRDIHNGYMRDYNEPEKMVDVDIIKDYNDAVTGSEFDTVSLAKLGFVPKVDLYKGIDKILVELSSDMK